MQIALAWLLAGLLLVVVELMNGTFYLLILGLAAGIGVLVAYFDRPFWMQALIVSIAAGVGAMREKRALIAKSEGQRQQEINVADGEKQAKILSSEGDKTAQKAAAGA